MTAQVVKGLTDPVFLIALLVGIAVFATFFTLMPSLAGNTLKSRMKSVALERDELRIKQRAGSPPTAAGACAKSRRSACVPSSTSSTFGARSPTRTQSPS